MSGAVVVRREAEFEPHWRSPRADEIGFRRGFVEGVSATSFMVNVLVLPPGQGCPRHDFGGDVVALVLEGKVEFVADAQSYELEPHDMLLLPAGVVYAYRNVGDGEARFVSIAGRVDEWPAKARYEGLEGEVVVHGR
jgi:quercetin dioxygenase-like cupin family protein